MVVMSLMPTTEYYYYAEIVEENIIGQPFMQNNFGTLSNCIFFSLNIWIAILNFSLLLHILLSLFQLSNKKS